jgi:hypothetical protein
MDILGLMRTIGIILLFYYGFKFLAKFILPYFAKSLINKAQQNMQNQYDSTHKPHAKPEGEVTINTSKDNTSSTHQVEAEDVDFEEIKE